MAKLLVDGPDLVVRLSWWERIAARRSRDVRVPLRAVARVAEEPCWWRVLRGRPASGWCIPGVFCVGVWGDGRRRDFVAVRPGTPVVVVDTRGRSPFARLAVSVRDAHITARTVEAHAPAGR